MKVARVSPRTKDKNASCAKPGHAAVNAKLLYGCLSFMANFAFGVVSCRLGDKGVVLKCMPTVSVRRDHERCVDFQNRVCGVGPNVCCVI